MRLGQLSRLYKLSQDAIIAYLNDKEPENAPYHNNSKLNDLTEELIANHFDKDLINSAEEPEELIEESLSEVDDQILEAVDIEDNSMEAEEHLQRELDPTLPPIQEPQIKEIAEVEEVEEIKEEAKLEPKSIDSDRLLELLEADENVDLSDYTIIKAPKKELEGLKVLGKIDLPEPKVKSEPIAEEEDEDSKKPNPDRSQRQRISEEEREKRRLIAKKKKEEYEERQERRRKAAELRKKKAQKRANYEKQLQKSNINQPKVKPSKKEAVQEEEPIQERQKPTTLLGKLWGWFWHGD